MSGAYPPAGAFHWRDGLFFERTPDREIHIFTMHPADTDRRTVALIPRAEWSSILGALARVDPGTNRRLT